VQIIKNAQFLKNLLKNRKICFRGKCDRARRFTVNIGKLGYFRYIFENRPNKEKIKPNMNLKIFLQN